VRRSVLSLLCLAALLCPGQALGVAGLGPVLSITPPAAAPVGPPVTGYSLWLDATYASNTNSVWYDQSGGGHNATPTSHAPVLTANAVNGNQCYAVGSTKTGSAYTDLATPSFARVNPVTVFVVFQAITTTTYAGPIDCGYSSQYSIQYSSSYGSEFWFAGTNYLNHDTPNTNTHCLAETMGSGTIYAYKDGTLLNGAGTAATGGSAGNFIRYLYFQSYNRESMDGYLCEIVEYPFVLSSGQFTSVEGYLSTKWGPLGP